MFPFMTAILFRHIEYVYSMYESSWNVPLIRYTWMLDAFPSKTLWRGKKRLLLSILHCYSKTFQYKCTSDTRGVPPRWIVIIPKANLREQSGYQETVHQGSLLCGRVRGQIILLGLKGRKILPPPPYSLCRKHGCQYATINKFWAWPCKAVFRYMPKGLPRQGGGLQEMVCVSFLERPLLLCVLVPFSSPSQTLCWPSRSITYHSFCVWQSVMKDTEQNTGDTWWPWIQTVLSCGQKQRNFHVPWQDSTVKERAAYLHPSQS